MSLPNYCRLRPNERMASALDGLGGFDFEGEFKLACLAGSTDTGHNFSQGGRQVMDGTTTAHFAQGDFKRVAVGILLHNFLSVMG